MSSFCCFYVLCFLSHSSHKGVKADIQELRHIFCFVYLFCFGFSLFMISYQSLSLSLSPQLLHPFFFSPPFPSVFFYSILLLFNFTPKIIFNRVSNTSTKQNLMKTVIMVKANLLGYPLTQDRHKKKEKKCVHLLQLFIVIKSHQRGGFLYIKPSLSSLGIFLTYTLFQKEKKKEERT